MTVRAPSAESEHGHPESQGSPAMGEKEKLVEVRNRDGSKVLEPGVGGVGAHCCQLCTEGGGAVWRQVAILENGHQGILLIPVRRRSDRVDRAPGCMSSA